MEKIIIILIFIIVFSLIVASIYSSKTETTFKVYNDITPFDYFKKKNSSTITSTSSTAAIEKEDNTCEESERVFIYPDIPCLGFSENAMMPAMSCGVVLNNIDVSYST